VCAEKNRQQLKDDLRIELAEYVALRKRLGTPLTFARALLGHREVCVENSIGDPDGYWLARVALLDELARDEGVMP